MSIENAAYRTANKLLDEPRFVRLCEWGNQTDLQRRLINALIPLGYVCINTDDPDPRNFVSVHSKVHNYFRKHGEQFVLLLEATNRLQQP